MDYSTYRLMVLSKTNGGNIHKVNGLLGHIMTFSQLLPYYESISKDKKQRAEESIKNCMKEIYLITGVSIEKIS